MQSNACYFGVEHGYATPSHPGKYRSCCGQYICDAHADRWDMRVPAAVAEGVNSLINRALGRSGNGGQQG